MHNHRLGKLEKNRCLSSYSGIVPFRSILLTEEFEKITEIMYASWPFYHYVLKTIFLVARNLNVQGKMVLYVNTIGVMFI